MRCYFFGVCVALGLLLITSPSRADSLTFKVIPPDVSGPAGTTVGWGFSITNAITSADFLDISGIDSNLFSSANGTPDASIFPFPNLAPGDTATQLYDPVGQLGLFQFKWNSGLSVGTTESGQFRLLGAFCDPAVDQFCAEDNTVASAVLASVGYSATVSPSGVAAVPEPSSVGLLLAGIGSLLVLRKRVVSSAGG
ncbi:MAG TPA: PEP-CTERM sorting domain-containing protein [Bryobacteraceae bacterium]|nr:PEP-CTERM sorting domain-containing protein [Bryobacteraceae bacterium]